MSWSGTIYVCKEDYWALWASLHTDCTSLLQMCMGSLWQKKRPTCRDPGNSQVFGWDFAKLRVKVGEEARAPGKTKQDPLPYSHQPQ